MSTALAQVQFSLSRLMIAVTVIALVLGVLVIAEDLVFGIIAIFVWCVFPTPFIILALFGRGDLRAFAIGGLVPWLTYFRGVPGSVELLFSLIIVSPICGAVAVAAFRWLGRHK
jgi:hypothetical protein